MQIRKFALLLLMVISMMVNVFAAGPLNQETGSISVTMQHDGEAVPGGSLTAYHVAILALRDENYEFVFTQEFLNCELPLENLNDELTVYQCAEFAAENDIKGVTKNIDADGKVCFADLPIGLYLVVQTEAAEGYYAASPFLISIPVTQNDEWQFDVDASPKVEVNKEPTNPTTPNQPDNPDEPGTPDSPGTPNKPGTPGKPGTPNIPQTGQLKWPIPVLSVAGLLLFILGWALCFRKREEKK